MEKQLFTALRQGPFFPSIVLERQHKRLPISSPNLGSNAIVVAPRLIQLMPTILYLSRPVVDQHCCKQICNATAME